MKVIARGLAAEYAAALEDYLAGAGEAALQRAYELGRRALGSGLGVLDMATIQHRALVTGLRPRRTPREGSRTLDAARRFFIESLSPFEMAHRGVLETNAALRESEQRYRDVVETARDVIYTLSPDGRITSLNPVFETITGWPRADWLGKGIAALIHPDDATVAMTLFQRVLAGERPPMFELRIVARSGGYIAGEFSATPQIQDGRVVGVLGIARDITERKRAEEALRRLNEALEEEVKRIAHALHDEAGQLLASVHIALAEVARDLPDQASLRLDEVRRLLDKIQEELRQLSHELRPTILDDLGLVPALQFLGDGVSKRSGLRIAVEGAVERQLPSGVETALYRIVQEALTNVNKHAQATSVRIQLTREGRMLRCSIRDDGVGFVVPAVLTRRGARGLGLIGIRERLAAVGGVLEIHSAPGQGVDLRMRLPLDT